MSSIRRLGVEIWGNASGYIGAVNQVLYGTNRMSQGFRSAGRDSTLYGNQMKALGTTIRYALAGQIVFGVTAALSRLQDFENQLGTIDSLAGQIVDGKFRGLGGALDDLGTQAIITANKFGIATSDVESYMERFYSAFDQGSRSKKQMVSLASSWANLIGGLQVVLGTEAGDPNALAGGIAGFLHSTGGTKNLGLNANKVGNMIAYVLAKTPSLTGSDIATGMGRIGAVTQTGRFTPEQVMAVWGLAAKAGGSPSIVTRGVAQLLGQSIMHPKSVVEQAAFTQAGLPTDPNLLRKMGGYAVLKQMLTYAQNTGTNGEPNVTWLYNAFGRIQSVQQFINLLGRQGPKALDDFLAGLKQAEKQQLLQSREQDAMKRRGLAQLSIGGSNFMLGAVRGLNPVLQPLGRSVAAASSFAAQHRTTEEVLAIAGLGYGAGSLLAKTPLGRIGAAAGKVNRFGKLFGGRNLVSGATRAAILAEESPAVLTGGAADGSRANPFWVVISPYSWYVGSPGGTSPFSSPTGSHGNKVPPVITNIGKLSTLARIAGPAAIAATFGYAGLRYYQSSISHPDKSVIDPATGLIHRAIPGLPMHARQGNAFGVDAVALALAKAHFMPERVISVKGDAKADLTIRLVDKNGNEITVQEKKGVPIRITSNNAPTSQGKTGKRGGK